MDIDGFLSASSRIQRQHQQQPASAIKIDFLLRRFGVVGPAFNWRSSRSIQSREKQTTAGNQKLTAVSDTPSVGHSRDWPGESAEKQTNTLHGPRQKQQKAAVEMWVSRRLRSDPFFGRDGNFFILTPFNTTRFPQLSAMDLSAESGLKRSWSYVICIPHSPRDRCGWFLSFDKLRH